MLRRHRHRRALGEDHRGKASCEDANYAPPADERCNDLTACEHETCLMCQLLLIDSPQLSPAERF